MTANENDATLKQSRSNTQRSWRPSGKLYRAIKKYAQKNGKGVGAFMASILWAFLENYEKLKHYIGGK